jgi:beta-glucosidase/6-phospho-beta-glucosidase/beta-galactosidase
MANQTEENPAGDVNMAGVEHYISFLEALKAANIKPAVTMWHWDTPNDLEVNY